MKLSKFVKRAKSESYCVVIHADDSGIWLGTRLALYNATELPYMEGKEQAGAVLDIDSKAWEKMFFDEKYTAHAGADFGMNLTETDPTEQEARRVPLEMFYKGMGLVGLMYGNGGELIFYDAALIAPIADVVKTSDYIQTVVRKTAGGAPYVVIKDGFEVLAGFAPLKIITKQFLEDLSEFESACVSQYMREQKQALDAADPDKQDEDAEQIGMEGGHVVPMEIDEHTVVRLSLRSMINPELRYFFAYEEVYQEQKQEITAMLKRRNITKREVDSVYGIAEVGRQ